jgi:hypothetical protein
MRPLCLGIVGLDVDPTDTGATFLVASSLDSVLTRWSLDGKQEARKELGPAESWAVSIHPRTLHLATAGNEGKVKILSSAVDNFGEEIYAMDATGAFATTVNFVSSLRNSAQAALFCCTSRADWPFVSRFLRAEPRRPLPRRRV